ncbi:MAG: hypothetical protein HYY96_14270, partial [Candidatus Tectomicrobia bacterium]|nr:hypothetical protein [Candidatus Tectomicrobia bacterium]
MNPCRRTVSRVLSTLLLLAGLAAGAALAAAQQAPAGGGIHPEGAASAQRFDRVDPEVASRKRCLSCHEGIESINQAMALTWGADTKCEVCHAGNPTANTKDAAHQGMHADPGDYRVVEQTCGQCHSDTGKLRADVQGLIPNVRDVSRVVSRSERDHVNRGLRSRMATAAGEINTLRYLWGAQESPAPRYGTRGVRALPSPSGEQPPAAPEKIEELPGAGASHADALLRRACLSCHLWSGGEASFGRYRGSGCTACHVPYADDGRSRSGDPTLDREKPGHPERHTITVRVPTSQCLHCHRNAGLHLGPSFTGRLEARAAAPLGEPGDRPGSRLLRL